MDLNPLVTQFKDQLDEKLPLTSLSAHYHVNLKAGRLPVTTARSVDLKKYLVELVWQLRGAEDIHDLKQANIDDWDAFVMEDGSIVGNYRPIERATAFGDSSKIDELSEWLKPLMSPVKRNGWAAEDIMRNGELTKVWRHPDIDVAGHAWCDANGVGGSPSMLMAGQIMGDRAPILHEGYEAFRMLILGQAEEATFEKRLPYDELNSFIITYKLKELDDEALQQYALLNVPGFKEDTPLDKTVRQALPRYELLTWVGIVSPGNTAVMNMAMIQAAMLTHILGSWNKLVVNDMAVGVTEYVFSRSEMEDEIYAVKAAEQEPRMFMPNPAIEPTQMFAELIDLL